MNNRKISMSRESVSMLSLDEYIAMKTSGYSSPCFSAPLDSESLDYEVELNDFDEDQLLMNDDDEPEPSTSKQIVPYNNREQIDVPKVDDSGASSSTNKEDESSQQQMVLFNRNFERKGVVKRQPKYMPGFSTNQMVKSSDAVYTTHYHRGRRGRLNNGYSRGRSIYGRLGYSPQNNPNHFWQNNFSPPGMNGFNENFNNRRQQNFLDFTGDEVRPWNTNRLTQPLFPQVLANVQATPRINDSNPEESGDMSWVKILADFCKNAEVPKYNLNIQSEIHDIQDKTLLCYGPQDTVVSSDGPGIDDVSPVVHKTNMTMNTRFM